MKVEVERVTDWERVVDAARMTAHKDVLGHEPSDSFKKRIIVAEHSPLRLLEFDVRLYGVPYFAVMHLVRHNQGVEKFVATSREDRTGVKREERRQTDLVDAQFSLNAQALINISRKRLCTKADPQTRAVWREVVREVAAMEPVLARACIPECVYRGFCPEQGCCGYVRTKLYEEVRKGYTSLVEG